MGERFGLTVSEGHHDSEEGTAEFIVGGTYDRDTSYHSQPGSREFPELRARLEPSKPTLSKPCLPGRSHLLKILQPPK